MCALHPTVQMVRIPLPLYNTQLTQLQNMHIRLGCKMHVPERAEAAAALRGSCGVALRVEVSLNILLRGRRLCA